jgi:phosphatidylethanolamine-binding protein (PEBP) family uncharacterized protein/Spy/CpxP family protein refolding chaperone
MRVVATMLAVLLLTTFASAQDRGDAQPLTAEQKAKVKVILSRYEADSLTAKDAKAINTAFREAGLRNGPGLQEAIKEADFVPERISELDPPPDRAATDRLPAGESDGSPQGKEDGKADRRRPDRGGGYSVEQAISDRAQLHTIAFDGLAFLTGAMACSTFLPPGKVADFCGFQYMRDVDVNQLGHNTSFVPLAANNVLRILTDEQKAQLIALALEQEKLLAVFGHKRFPLIEAFHRQLAGDIPEGSKGLDRKAVMKYAAELYEIDGRLSYRRAEVLGGIVRALTDEQKSHLGKLKFNDSSTWPELTDQVDKRSMSHAAHVAVMTYASEMFSWYAGNVEADVYFCPERHATYFGAFFMKDIPAMGDPDFTISTSLTGDSGEAFLSTLGEDQRKLVTGLVDQQRADLKEIVQVRRQIATLLRSFMKQEKVDEDRVLALSRRYGELDGEVSYFYARAFAEVAQTLTADQKKKLAKLRNLDPKYTPKGAFLYSAPIAMPEIPDTDFLFVEPAASKVKTTKAKTTKAATPTDRPGEGSLELTSPEVVDGGRLPKDYTGDGSSATLPLSWAGIPEGTRRFILIMHHVAPDGTKWYWTLYDIPATATKLPKNVSGVGKLGTNSVNRRCEYAPPHSKGPGDKAYVYTLYALSSQIELDVKPTEVNRDVLLAAMKDKVLATAQLRVVYARDVAPKALKAK